MKFTVIDKTEIEDVIADIRANGQLPQDFELSEKVTGCEKGVATVRSKKSGVERDYPIGNATTFPADFAQELEQGIFR